MGRCDGPTRPTPAFPTAWCSPLRAQAQSPVPYGSKGQTRHLVAASNSQALAAQTAQLEKLFCANPEDTGLVKLKKKKVHKPRNPFSWPFVFRTLALPAPNMAAPGAHPGPARSATCQGAVQTRPGAAERMRNPPPSPRGPPHPPGPAQDVGAGGLRVPGEARPRAGAGGPVGGQGLAHHGAEPLPRRLQHPGKRRRRTAAI